MAADALLVLPAYLLGTVPTAHLVGARAGHDPTTEGSRNPGASNVYRTAGRRAGALVLLGDLAKGIAATGAGLAVGGRPLGLACGAAAVVGHVFPVTRRFRGGKGVATAAGLVLVLHPVVAAVGAAVWAIAAKASGRASLGSIAVAVAAPVAAAVGGAPAWDSGGLALVSALVVARHAGNIARLVRGEERTLGVGP